MRSRYSHNSARSKARERRAARMRMTRRVANAGAVSGVSATGKDIALCYTRTDLGALTAVATACRKRSNCEVCFSPRCPTQPLNQVDFQWIDASTCHLQPEAGSADGGRADIDL